MVTASVLWPAKVARLVHACVDQLLPEGDALVLLGRAAILAFLNAKGVVVADVAPEEIAARESAEYDRVFHLLTDTMEKFVEQKVSKVAMFPPIVDFMTALGLMAGGEPVVRLMMARMEERISDWREGRFPAAGEPWPTTPALRIPDPAQPQLDLN
jgi:hypothetical protein